MSPELKARWVEALRSDKYAQGRETLRDDDGSMCCLGVLREIVEPGSEETHDYAEYLCPRLAEEVGLSHEDQVLLANMNDGGGTYGRPHSFAEIADHIERTSL